MCSSCASRFAGSSHGDLLRSGAASTTECPARPNAAISSRTCTEAPFRPRTGMPRSGQTYRILTSEGPLGSTLVVCFTGSLKELAKLCGVAVDVELCLDQTPRPSGEPGAQIRPLEKPSDGRGECGGIPLRDHEPRLSVAYRFRDSGYVGRDAGRAQGHRLQKNGRQAVAVPIGADDARRGEHRCVLDESDQLALGAGPEQLDAIFESQARNPHPQPYLLLAGTDDPAGERSEEHTSELQSRQYLVCRLLLEKKKQYKSYLLLSTYVIFAFFYLIHCILLFSVFLCLPAIYYVCLSTLLSAYCPLHAITSHATM